MFSLLLNLAKVGSRPTERSKISSRLTLLKVALVMKITNNKKVFISGLMEIHLHHEKKPSWMLPLPLSALPAVLLPNFRLISLCSWRAINIKQMKTWANTIWSVSKVDILMQDGTKIKNPASALWNNVVLALVWVVAIIANYFPTTKDAFASTLMACLKSISLKGNHSDDVLA
eukprot:scaffold103252_cov56-Attheya_sp.AAC.3